VIAALLASPLARLIAVGAISFVVGYGWGWLDYRQDVRVGQLKTEIVVLKHNLKVAEADARVAASNQADLVLMDAKIKELTNALSDKSRVCFDAPDTDRVRDLWD
jgi:hypothetical protein